ncbi:Lrp/AsnC family transcriptional regulator [Cryptosporangium sp. NPDC051539]|uniref:Lrp/AsnC family transcriptional regulator n=1 Tax=Cryptosporangium sp. NPDC051539 TaxID=3363962 RepID=UPI0037A020CD
MRSALYDELDLKLLHALQIDGRAPFNRIAEVLDVSDRTIARRYARLRATNRVKVTCRTDSQRVGETLWFVRVRCALPGAREIGDALARRADTSWVKVISGGTEIVATVRAPHDGGEPLLLDRLPRTPQVLEVSANSLLHIFQGESQSFLDALTAEQVDQLRPEAGPERHMDLSEDDLRLIGLLRRDGRTDLAALAAATGHSTATLRRRLTELRSSGVLYFYVRLDFRDLGMTSQTMLWLSVAPDHMVAVGEALAQHPEVVFAAATTGSTNIYAVVMVPDSSSLFGYLSGRVPALPAIHRIETAPVLENLKIL